MKLDSFVSNNMNSQPLPSQIPSITQPSHFGFENQPRTSSWVPAASRFFIVLAKIYAAKSRAGKHERFYTLHKRWRCILYRNSKYPTISAWHPTAYSNSSLRHVQSVPTDTTNPSSLSYKHLTLEDIAAFFHEQERPFT